MTSQEFITKAQVAAMFEIDERTVTRWQGDTKDPLPIAVKGRRGVPHKYDLAAVHQWGVRRALAEKIVDGEVYNYDQARAKLTTKQAEKAELEVAQLRGDLIPAEVVAATWTETVINMRARILALPSRAAHQVEAAEDLDEIREILTLACRDALDEIATDDLSDDQLTRVESAARGIAEGEAAAAA